MNVLTVKEAAQILGMSERHTYDELRAGNLRGANYGHRWHIPEQSITDYIEAHMNVAPRSRRTRKAVA